MRTHPWLLAKVAAVLLLVASSANAAPGVAMRWDLCYADGGAANKDFACNTNVGANTLTVSFSPPQDMDQVNGNEVIVDLLSASATLPQWWQVKNSLSCRQTGLGVNFVIPAGSTNCIDIWQDQGTGGIGAYNLSFFGAPNRARLSAVIEVPYDAMASVLAGHEYFSMNVRINNLKTVGTGACPGCLTPMCLVVSSVKIMRAVGLGDVILTQPLGPNSAAAAWQGGSPALVFTPPDGTNPGYWFINSCGLPTPARNQTWGAIKSMYR